MPPIAKDCGINSINIQLTQLRSGLYWEVRRPAAPPHLIDTTAFPRIALRAAEPHPRQSTSSYRLFVLPEYLATRSSDPRSHSEEKRAGPGRDSQTRRDSRFRNCDIYAVYELKSEDKPFSEILMGDIQTSHQYSPAVPISRTRPPYSAHSLGSGAVVPEGARGSSAAAVALAAGRSVVICEALARTDRKK
jgi:hypothetical protein